MVNDRKIYTVILLCIVYVANSQSLHLHTYSFGTDTDIENLYTDIFSDIST